MSRRVKIPILNHRTWNDLMRRVGRRLPIRVTTKGFGSTHPWKVTPFWASSEKEYDATKGEWRMMIEPGFVNGIDAEISTIANLANLRTHDRFLYAEESRVLKDDDKIEARLTERPIIPVPASIARTLGGKPSDADIGMANRIAEAAAQFGLSGGAAETETTSFEPVPKFFHQFGVKVAGDDSAGPENPNPQGPGTYYYDNDGNLIGGPWRDGSGAQSSLLAGTGASSGDEEAPKGDPPLLRALDVALYYGRAAFKIDNSVRGTPAEDGFTNLLSYTYSRNSTPNPRPYLRVLTEYQPPQVGAASMLEGAADPEYDSIKVATVYFLSSAASVEGAPVDGTWIPFVEHNLFWNLAHAKQRLITPADPKPITVRTGLAFGLGDIVNQQILSPQNDAYALALLQMKARTLEGRFWSV